MSSGGRERRIWKAWEGIMCCWFMALWWPGRKKAVSLGYRKMGRNKWRPGECFLRTRNAVHSLTNPVRSLQQGGSYEPRFVGKGSGFKRISKEPKVIPLVRGRKRIWTLFISLQNPHFFDYTRLKQGGHKKTTQVLTQPLFLQSVLLQYLLQ